MDLKQNIMEKISGREVKMLPRAYFIAGNVFLVMGIALGFLITSLFFSLLFFRMEAGRPMGITHLNWLTKIPWEYGLLAVVFLIISLFLLKKSEIAYKINFSVLLLAVLLVSMITGFLIKQTTPTRNLIRRVPYHRRDYAPQRKNLPQKHLPRSPKYQRKTTSLL